MAEVRLNPQQTRSFAPTGEQTVPMSPPAFATGPLCTAKFARALVSPNHFGYWKNGAGHGGYSTGFAPSNYNPISRRFGQCLLNFMCFRHRPL